MLHILTLIITSCHSRLVGHHYDPVAMLPQKGNSLWHIRENFQIFLAVQLTDLFIDRAVPV